MENGYKIARFQASLPVGGAIGLLSGLAGTGAKEQTYKM